MNHSRVPISAYKAFRKNFPIREVVELTSIECGCVRLTGRQKDLYDKMFEAILYHHKPFTLYVTPFFNTTRYKSCSLAKIRKTLQRRFELRALLHGVLRLNITMTQGLAWIWLKDLDALMNDPVQRERIELEAERQRLLDRARKLKSSRKMR